MIFQIEREIDYSLKRWHLIFSYAMNLRLHIHKIDLQDNVGGGQYIVLDSYNIFIF